MTDELNKASAEQEKMEPLILRKMLPVGAGVITAVVHHTLENSLSGKVTVESPPGWLEPMEEDYDDEDADDRIIEQSTKKSRDDVRKAALVKHVKVGLKRVDVKPGFHMRGTMKIKSVGMLDDRLSSETPSPDSHLTRTPEISPRTPQSISRSLMSTPQLTPNGISQPPNTEFRSPPRLTRVSPLNVDASRTQNHPFPGVRQGSFAHQKTSSASPGKDSRELSPHLWLCPSLEPISPTKGSAHFRLQTLNPKATFNGRKTSEEEGLPLLSDCVSCGSPFPAETPGQKICHRCKREKKHPPPNIIFKKVGQDQWVVGKTTHPRKQNMKPRKIIEQDYELDDDDDDDDEQGGGPKKRSRRMCRQCVACLIENDCGECDFCMDKPKFGGSNKKKQKCRLRQCQFQSRLYANAEPDPVKRKRKIKKPKYKKRGRPRKQKQKHKRNPWDDNFTDTEDDKEELRHTRMKSPRVRKRKWKYSFKEEEEEMFVEAVIEDDKPANSEEASIVLGNERLVNENNLSVCGFSPQFQNENVKIVVAGNSEHCNRLNIVPPPQSQGIFYMPGLQQTCRMYGPVPLYNSNPVPLGGVVGASCPLPLGEAVNQNGAVKFELEVVRVGSPLSQCIAEPQNTAQHVPAPQHEVPSVPTPVITRIFSLAVETENDSDRDPGLIELLNSLRQTLLPAHWVGVMAEGPILQLLQCSKLSNMADTVVQIEKGFFYQISVQNQPLLLTHSIYERHPTCLTSVYQVVSLLLDLEGLSVCQGYESLEPMMCVRAALCDLLIPKDEEQCEKCEQ